VPSLNIGGWYDIFLGTTLQNYSGMKQRGGSAVARQHQRLLIDPWSHGSLTGIFPERNYGLMASGDAADIVGIQLRSFSERAETDGARADLRVAPRPVGKLQGLQSRASHPPGGDKLQLPVSKPMFTPSSFRQMEYA
jgi:uncharacterized protein